MLHILSIVIHFTSLTTQKHRKLLHNCRSLHIIAKNYSTHNFLELMYHIVNLIKFTES